MQQVNPPHMAQQYIMSFGQSQQQEQTSRISQTSGDSLQNQSHSGKKFLKNTISFKNQ